MKALKNAADDYIFVAPWVELFPLDEYLDCVQLYLRQQTKFAHQTTSVEHMIARHTVSRRQVS